jgi:hypothetical protein
MAPRPAVLRFSLWEQPESKEKTVNLRNLTAALMAFAAGLTLLLSASAAGAAVTRPHPHLGVAGTKAPTLRTAPPRITNLPNGYTVVSNTLTSYAGSQTSGAAQCPGTEQPVGGGAFVASDALTVNINSSYPDGGSWAVDLDNASSLPTTYYVYAVCIAHSAKYRVVHSPVETAYPGWVTSKAVNCPRGTVVLGGGAESGTPDTDVYINSTVPNQLNAGRTAWRVAMASYDTYNTSFTVYAVCEPKPAGYSIQYGQPVGDGPLSETEAVVTCPGASVPVGGGGFTDFTNTDAGIGVNTSYPSGQSWDIYENNNQGVVTRSLYASAVCAGT